MARIDKIKEKVRATSKNLSKSEVKKLLEHLGISYVR